MWLGGEQNQWSGEMPPGGLSTCSRRTGSKDWEQGGGEGIQGGRAARAKAWGWDLLDHAEGGTHGCSFLGPWAVLGPRQSQRGEGTAELLGCAQGGRPGGLRPAQRQLEPWHHGLHSWIGWAWPCISLWRPRSPSPAPADTTPRHPEKQRPSEPFSQRESPVPMPSGPGSFWGLGWLGAWGWQGGGGSTAILPCGAQLATRAESCPCHPTPHQKRPQEEVSSCPALPPDKSCGTGVWDIVALLLRKSTYHSGLPSKSPFLLGLL